MKKIHLLLLLGLFCFVDFNAEAQRRYHNHRRGGWNRHQRAFRYVARPLFWGVTPRVIVTPPPLVIGRGGYGYRRAYNSGYQEGRRRRMEDDRRREDDQYRRDNDGYDRRDNDRYRREGDYNRRDEEYRRPAERHQPTQETPRNRNYDEESVPEDSNDNN